MLARNKLYDLLRRMPLGGDNLPSSTFHDQGKFGRLFPTLPAFAADNPTLRAALKEVGKKNSIMDAQDNVDDPVGLITKPKKSPHNPNNSTLTAGMTFLGQFIDYDMMFDPTSSLERQQDPETIDLPLWSDPDDRPYQKVD